MLLKSILWSQIHFWALILLTGYQMGFKWSPAVSSLPLSHAPYPPPLPPPTSICYWHQGIFLVSRSKEINSNCQFQLFPPFQKYIRHLLPPLYDHSPEFNRRPYSNHCHIMRSSSWWIFLMVKNLKHWHQKLLDLLKRALKTEECHVWSYEWDGLNFFNFNFF